MRVQKEAQTPTLASAELLRSDSSFGAELQASLVELSSAVSGGHGDDTLAQLFCQKVRVLLAVSGAYFWRLENQTSLLGIAADGHRAGDFAGQRLQMGRATAASQALHARSTCYLNRLDPHEDNWETSFDAKSVMAAPV